MAAFVMNRGGRGRGRRNARPIADINVTPMVDVMLVLLIVFMVTAPLLTVGVPVDLPKTDAPTINEQKEPLVISINAQGQTYVGDAETPIEDLVPKLQAVTSNNPSANIYVRGDKAIDYGRVLQVMGLVSAAGFTKVSLIAEAPPAGGLLAAGTTVAAPVRPAGPRATPPAAAARPSTR